MREASIYCVPFIRANPSFAPKVKESSLNLLRIISVL